MKKGFTNSMRFRLESAYCDLSWCKPVSNQENEAIKNYLHENPQKKKQFDDYKFCPNPSIVNMWINMDEVQEKQLLNYLTMKSFPCTMNDIINILHECRLCSTKPPTSHLLNLLFLPWEVDEEGNELFNSFDLRRC